MKPIQIQRIDKTKLNEDLDNLATDLHNDMINEEGVNYVCNKLTNRLYEACTRNYRKRIKNTTIDIPHIENCTSRNVRAIAESNFECFQYHLRENKDPEKIKFYREKWSNSEKNCFKKGE